MYQNISKRTYSNHTYQDKYKGLSFASMPGFQMNEVQLRMYKTVLHGLHAYTVEELELLSAEEKSTIINSYRKGQQLINKWKQSIVYGTVDDLLSKLFPNSKLVKNMLDRSPDRNEFCRFSFKELGITQNMIIEKLMRWQLLPSNFYQIA